MDQTRPFPVPVFKTYVGVELYLHELLTSDLDKMINLTRQSQYPWTRAAGTHGIGLWMVPEPVWLLWR